MFGQCMLGPTAAEGSGPVLLPEATQGKKAALDSGPERVAEDQASPLPQVTPLAVAFQGKLLEVEASEAAGHLRPPR